MSGVFHTTIYRNGEEEMKEIIDRLTGKSELNEEQKERYKKIAEHMRKNPIKIKSN